MPRKIKENKIINLAIVSFLILFLELILIRFIGTEIRIFAYVPNLILLAAFIGSGLGILVKKKLPLYMSSVALILVLVASNLEVFKNITNLLSPISDSFIWFQASGINSTKLLTGFLLTVLLFLMVLVVFMSLGQYLGEIFDKSENLIMAYSINIVFSLLGTLAFNYFSSLHFSPYLMLILCLLLVAAITNKEKLVFSFVSAIIATPLLVASLAGTNQVVWSPYQKLELVDLPNNPILPDGKMLNVNNIGYMGLLDLSESYQNSIPQKLKDLGVTQEEIPELEYMNQYDLPYKLNQGAKDVLLIGAGAGNDAAGAVRMGAENIVAVEIDPEIIEFGKNHHPESPYSSEKVTIVNNDGRAYLQKTNEKYDVVVMGLTDSHTLNSSLTNIQLDNFLYTKQSLEDIHNVLKDDGLLFLSFDVRRDWIGARLRGSIEEAFGQEPLIISMQNDPPLYGWGGVFFVVSKDGQKLENTISSNENIRNFVETRKVNYELPNKYLTDNWPYIYLKSPKIPNIHLIISVILIGLFTLPFKLLKIKQGFKHIPFFLGAAFLLYEFQNISRASLLYGNTWKTNAFIISTILIMILLANMLSLKFKFNKKLLYILLIISFVIELVIPVNMFVHTEGIIKYAVIPVLLNLPLFFSGLLFIQYFNQTKERKSFYAYNLFGSAVGGLVSYTSYMFGISFLIVLSLVFYIFTAFEFKRKNV